MVKVSKKAEKQKNHLDLDPLAFVSHELKTPLSTLKLNIELLRRQVSEKEGKALIDIMGEEVDWMIRFISDTLDFGEPDNKIHLNVNPLEWNKWMRSIQGSMERTTASFNRKLKVQQSTQEMQVRIDPLYTRQVLFNLLMNAVEYSFEKGTIEISWRREGSMLRVLVKDEGPGINEKDKDKIFELFYKGRTGVNRVIKGSGLGLAIVKKIVQAQGGAAYAENRPDGKGAVFVFTLPVSI